MIFYTQICFLHTVTYQLFQDTSKMRAITLALAIFCLSVVESRYQEFDRQWTAEDARQNCSTKCADECEYCKDPKYCNEDQFKCGEQAPEGGPDCPPDDICVPSGCECKKVI